MENEVMNEVIAAFADYTPGLPPHSTGKITIEKINNGLINNSYKIIPELKTTFLLQQINKNVFPKPEDVQRNYLYISQYAEFEFTGLRMPYPKYYTNNRTLFKDKNDNYWRAFEFINNSHTLNVAETPGQAKAAAKEFGKFTAAFEEMNVDNLRIVIPDFHNLSFRYQQFEESLGGEQYERMAIAKSLISELKNRERYKHFYELIISSEEFPKRVMHHDAKITNVLFDNTTHKVICLVDFDTVMPGYFFSDLGDLIRTLVSPVDEASIEFEKIKIRKSYYESIVSGYLSVMEKIFTASEKKYIHYAGIIMIYMQALRFLADYLNDDIYYKTEYAEQNFDRAKNQFILLQRLEEFLNQEYQFNGLQELDQSL
jgi:thiamine kinase-like enzyme